MEKILAIRRIGKRRKQKIEPRIPIEQFSMMELFGDGIVIAGGDS